MVDIPNIVVHDFEAKAARSNNVVVDPATGAFQLLHYRPISVKV